MRRGLVWSLIGIILIAFLSLAGTLLAGHSPLLGLDLKGGVEVVLKPQGTVDSATLDEAVNIIDRRVNGLGVSNSSVTKQGNDVVIELPGIKNSASALKVLGETAVLYFRPVYCTIQMPISIPTSTSTTVPKGGATTTTTKPASTSTTAKKALGASPDRLNLASYSYPAAASSTTTVPKTTTTVKSTTPTTAPSTTAPTIPYPLSTSDAQSICSLSTTDQVLIPSTPIGNDTASTSVILPYYDNSIRYVLGPADMKGNVVSGTSVIAPTAGGGYQVQVNFTSSGATEFDNIASQRYPYYEQDPSDPSFQSEEAIELDATVQSAPTIQASSFHGTAEISGSSSAPFTSSQASNLALVLRYGSLPVRFVPQSVETVSATIGEDSLKAGLAAGIGGIIVVMIYMMVYYRALGLVVFAGLAVGGSILYSIISELSVAQSPPFTLTLAGVTGIIVSVGITVDSYVVYFERLKDEVRSGRTVRQSVERSFARAFRTVLTADLVSFMAALVLYLFTVGDVRGFAYTLGLSTLLDVFTAYFFIRPAVILVGRRRTFTEARIFGVARGLGSRTNTREV